MPRAKLPIEPLHGAALGLAAIGLSLASFMQILDQTIANVSLPTIAGNLGVSPNQGAWVITSFGVATAISLPLTGWLAQRIGQVRLLRWSTLLFVLASVLCGLSNSLEMLVASRVLQGAVAGPMIPLSQAMLLAVYPPERRVTALSLWSLVTIIAPICGPLLGGWISDNWGWPWIFFINVPVGLIAATLTMRTFKGRETLTKSAPIDVAGLILLAVWVCSLQIMLDTGADAGWFDSGEVILLAVIAFAGFCYFIVWELTAVHPVVDLRLFARRNFLTGVGAASIGFMLFFGISIVMPLWLQTQMGYTAAWAGLAIAPVSLFPLLLSRSVSRWLQRSDPRLFASGAFLALAVASFMRAGFTTQVDFATVASAQVITGLGIALFMVPLQTISLSGLRNDQVASAAGLSSFMRVIGTSFGVSLAITIWGRREAVHRTQLSESVSAWEPADIEFLARMSDGGAESQQTYSLLERMLSNQSNMLGAIDFFWLTGWILLGLVVIVWFARPPFGAGRELPAE
ncbi:MAG: DHA2 family efflux MFS transporter permease subunit [Steroidobacter sp.]